MQSKHKQTCVISAEFLFIPDVARMHHSEFWLMPFVITKQTHVNVDIVSHLQAAKLGTFFLSKHIFRIPFYAS